MRGLSRSARPSTDGTTACVLETVPCSVETLPGNKARALAPPLPKYLVKQYGWAYLWRPSVWFFDHQLIINAILFGQYRAIMSATLRLIHPEQAGRSLQITSVYGELTPRLAEKISDLHLIDVAPVQLQLAQRKLTAAGLNAKLACMDCENLRYASASFDTALMFMLLHELPAEARGRALAEAIRILRPGGRLVIAEYGALIKRHAFHRFSPARKVLETAEPFLAEFWREDLGGILRECAKDGGRTVMLEASSDIFGGFYRVLSFQVN